jgi:hypothetical protein
MSKKVFLVSDEHPDFAREYGVFIEGKQLDEVKRIIKLIDDFNYDHYLKIEEYDIDRIHLEQPLDELSMSSDLEDFKEFAILNFEDANWTNEEIEVYNPSALEESDWEEESKRIFGNK